MKKDVLGRTVQSLTLVLLAYTASVHLAVGLDRIGEPNDVLSTVKLLWNVIGLLVVGGLTITGFLKIYDK